MRMAKEKKRKKSVGLWERYKVEGERVERKGGFCPKCGAGYYMAEHKERSYCGKCKYTEFGKKEQT